MSDIDKLREYRHGMAQDVSYTLESAEPNRDTQPRRFEVRFRFALISLRLEIKTKRPDGAFLMMTSRKKAPGPMTLLRNLGFKARSKVEMLKKAEKWALENGIYIHGVKA